MAEYLVLIYGDEKAVDAAGQELWDELMQRHGAFGEKHGASIRGGNALQPTGTATSLRVGSCRCGSTPSPSRPMTFA